MENKQGQEQGNNKDVIKLPIPMLYCKKCKHVWYPRRPRIPKVCPVCKRKNSVIYEGVR